MVKMLTIKVLCFIFCNSLYCMIFNSLAANLMV